MLRLSHVEDIGLPPGLPGARDMAIEDAEMFGLGLPPGLPGAVSMPTPEDFEMFGLGGEGDDSEYDLEGRAKLFAHEAIPRLIIGAVGYGIFAMMKAPPLKTAGAVVMGVALADVLAKGYDNFVPTDNPKTKKEVAVAIHTTPGPVLAPEGIPIEKTGVPAGVGLPTEFAPDGAPRSHPTEMTAGF